MIDWWNSLDPQRFFGVIVLVSYFVLRLDWHGREIDTLRRRVCDLENKR